MTEKEEMITGFFVDTENGTASVATIKNELASFYKLLRCDMIDAPSYKIGGKYYDVIADDEGLLKPSPLISVTTSDLHTLICGSVFIVNADEESGEWHSLTQDDINRIKEQVAIGIQEDKSDMSKPLYLRLKKTMAIKTDYSSSDISA